MKIIVEISVPQEQLDTFLDRDGITLEKFKQYTRDEMSKLLDDTIPGTTLTVAFSDENNQPEKQ